MNKIIVTTTINKPTKATIKFCEISEYKGWKFIIIGDLKTPHEEYLSLSKQYPNTIYLSPDKQKLLYSTLSDSIGWNTIQRRNIGFVHAYNLGVDILATVDDDNIPYDYWGDDIFIGKRVSVNLYTNKSCDYFDPLSVTEHSNLWHRGYPIDYVPIKNNIDFLGKTTITPLIQADLWDGDPDIDAICRLSNRPIVKFNITEPFTTNQITPFNSQNTFIHKSVIKFYSVLPNIGRMDDIWGAYILQTHIKNSIIFNRATVYQERNPQDLVTNLEKEILGYRKTKSLLDDLNNYESHLPKETIKFYNTYKKQFE